ncbi:uncharacterized protein MONBRDRAFT_12183 [Monosiga brevicollis MX1]|uniref:receptor protein-tyrosine kinase n=1 Tax=Monosiga brevicollis TaxID=81824 RepID=A9VBG8_MONBE|nr:uncharacterized protein MONBRDRAFT_12183 [Monosiga brevicollis MX1]EDQ85058.1 predicted protein [Monosiga brevicollis MX1]|eukprot:XP_001750062.1 hypothetical protein [Monosiga brevicollis MX1]
MATLEPDHTYSCLLGCLSLVLSAGASGLRAAIVIGRCPRDDHSLPPLPKKYALLIQVTLWLVVDTTNIPHPVWTTPLFIPRKQPASDANPLPALIHHPTPTPRSISSRVFHPGCLAHSVIACWSLTGPHLGERHRHLVPHPDSARWLLLSLPYRPSWARDQNSLSALASSAGALVAMVAPLRLSASSLLLFLSLAPAVALALNINRADLILSDVGPCELTLQFDGSVSATDVHLEQMILTEGWYAPPQTVVTSGPRRVDAQTLSANLDCVSHALNPASHSYTLSFSPALHADLPAGNSTLIVNLTRTAEAPLRLPANICTRLVTEGPATKDITITTLAQAQDMARRRCTGFFGALTFRNLTLSPADWRALLMPLRLVEGSLRFEATPGLQVEALGGLQWLAARGPYHQDERGTYGLRINNVPGFVVTDGLRLLSLRTGQRIVVIGSEAAQCPPADNEALQAWILSAPLVDLRYNVSACVDTSEDSNCAGAVDELTGLCRHSVTDKSVCPGGIITSLADLAPYSDYLCTVIDGSLKILGPLEFAEHELGVLARVEHVLGGVIVQDAPSLVSLDFLQSLRTANMVTVTDNVNLLDLRLPLLKNTIPMVLTSNPRLCHNVSRVLESASCGIVDVSARIRCPALAAASYNQESLLVLLEQQLSWPRSNIVLLPSFGTDTDVGAVIEVTLVASMGDSQMLRRAFQDLLDTGAWDRAAALLPSGQTLVGALFLQAPHRTPNAASAGSGIVLSAQTASTGALISWELGGLAPDSQASFVLQVQPRVSDTLVDELTAYAFTADLALDSYDVVFSQVRAALTAGMPGFDISLASTSQTFFLLRSCDAIIDGETVAIQQTCLDMDLAYDLRVLGFVDGSAVASDTITIQLADPALRVRNVSLHATGPSALTVHWAPPVAADRTAGYEVFIRYAGVDSNGAMYLLDAAQITAGTSNPTAFGVQELLLDGSRQRLVINDPTATNLELNGCYFNYHANATTCLAPFTVYVVGVRPVDGTSKGVTSYFVGTTGADMTLSEPPAWSMASETPVEVQGRSATLRLQRPVNMPAVATRVQAVVTGPYGERVMSRDIIDPLAHHVNRYNESMELALDHLAPYSNHTISLMFVDDMGVVSASRSVSILTAPGAPDAVASVSAMIEDDGRLRVTWLPPVVTPGPLVWYEVLANFENETETGELVHNGTATSITIAASLAQSQIAVRAVTPEGVSNFETTRATLASGQQELPVSYMTLGLAVGGAVLLLAVVGFVLRRRLRSLRKAAEDEWRVPEADEFEYPRERVRLGRQLGSGAFGMVFAGHVTDIREISGEVAVAVKLCSSKAAKEKNDFLEEANLMKRFAKPWHPNVLRLLGVVTQEEPMMIILENMANGDLLGFLRGARPPAPGQDAALTMTDLVYMAADVASGMAFLAQGNFIHRDLAARNCLVAEDMVVKVADFGLSRALNYSDYYRKNGQALLPVRWMCPMALCEGKFTTDTDVYSFGILLYELFTLGALPYTDMSNQQVFEQVVAGYRMEQPQGCPDVIYKIMWECWRLSDRPSFENLEERLMNIGRRLEDGDLTVLSSSQQTAPSASLGAGLPPTLVDEITGMPMGEDSAQSYTAMDGSKPASAVDYSKYEDMADAHVPLQPVAPSPKSTLTRHTRGARSDVRAAQFNADDEELQHLERLRDEGPAPTSQPTKRPDYVVTMDTYSQVRPPVPAPPLRRNPTQQRLPPMPPRVSDNNQGQLTRPSQLNPGAKAFLDSQHRSTSGASQGYDDPNSLFAAIRDRVHSRSKTPGSRHSSLGDVRSQHSASSRVSTSAL